MGLLGKWQSSFGTHKPPCAAKLIPYLTYFDKFIYKDWELSKHHFVVPKRFSALPLLRTLSEVDLSTCGRPFYFKVELVNHDTE